MGGEDREGEGGEGGEVLDAINAQEEFKEMNNVLSQEHLLKNVNSL